METTFEFVRINLEFTIELFIVEILLAEKYKKRASILCRNAFVCICLAVISLVASMDTLYYYLGSFGTMLHCFLVLLVSIVGMLFAYNCTFFQATVCGICAYTIQNIAFASHEIVKAAWMEIPFMPGYGTVADVATYLICFAGVYTLAYLCFIKKLMLVDDDAEAIKMIILPSLGMLFLVVVLSSFCHEFDVLEMILCRTASILGCAAELGTLLEFLCNRILRRELDFIRHESELRVNYYEQLQATIEATNIRCHDVKHQLAALREQKETLPENVLDDLAESINIYDSIAKTGCEALDIVLTEKALICQKDKIRFTYLVNFEEVDMLEKKDIYSLFGNALDNAIEAVRQVGLPEKRIINLSVTVDGPVLNVHIYNYYSTELAFEDGFPITTKKEKIYHGYGMKTIRLITEKYDGVVRITAQDEIFDLNIALPLAG